MLSTSTNVRQLTRNTREIDLKMSVTYDRFTVLERKDNKMSLKYSLTVKNFTCDECGAFSDELSNVTSDITDTTITALCCDTEYWVYDLNQLGYEVEEVIY